MANGYLLICTFAKLARPPLLPTQRLRGTETQNQHLGLGVLRELRVSTMPHPCLRVSGRNSDESNPSANAPGGAVSSCGLSAVKLPVVEESGCAA